MKTITEHYEQTTCRDIRMINFHNAESDYQLHLPDSCAGETNMGLMTVSIMDGDDCIDCREYLETSTGIYRIEQSDGYGAVKLIKLV